MIDIKKQYQEAKKLAKQLMQAGKIKEYISTLERIHQLQMELIRTR